MTRITNNMRVVITLRAAVMTRCTTRFRSPNRKEAVLHDASAGAQAECQVHDHLAGGHRTTRARVGLRARDAGRLGLEVRIATLPSRAVLRTRTIAEMSGLMKALVEAQRDRIRGFTMLGPEAGEVMAMVQTAMVVGMPSTGLCDAMFTRPTMAEGLVLLLANIPPKAAR